MRMLPSMLTSTQSDILRRLTDNFGQPANWNSKTGTNCSLWTTNLPFEIISPQEGGNDVHIRRTLENRRHLRTVPVILLADSDDPPKTRVVGPHEPYTVRKLNTTSVLNLIDHARQLNTRPAAAFLEREFLRLDKSVLPGIRVKELLTPHYIRTRLRQYSVQQGIPRNRHRKRQTPNPNHHLAHSIRSTRLPDRTARTTRLHPQIPRLPRSRRPLDEHT